MKKIAIALVVIAALLAVGCSSAAVKVDLAGNPETLAGTWSGSVTAKDTVTVDAPDIFTMVDDYDYQGTWVYTATDEPDVNYLNIEVDSGITYTAHIIFTPYTVTNVVQKVIAATGNYVQTTTKTETWAARAAITVPANTATTVDYYILDGGAPILAAAVVPAQLAGVRTTVTVKTVVVGTENNEMFNETTNETVTVTHSGALYPAASSETSKVSVSPTAYDTELVFDDLTFIDNLDPAAPWVFTHTITVAAKDSVQYQDDLVSTYTFVVLVDGTYTLTLVTTTTQAAADASVEDDDFYAAPARLASVKTETIVVAGVVAAFTAPATTTMNAVNNLVFSGKALTYTVVGTEDFEGDTTDITEVYQDWANETYSYEMLQGDGKKDDVIKTRMVIGNFYVADGVLQTVVLDKAIVAEE